MALRKEIIEIDGRKIEIKEISFAGQLRLEQIEKISTMDFYKECLSEDDFKFLEQVGKDDFVKLRTAMSEVNGWDKKEKDKDFQ